MRTISRKFLAIMPAWVFICLTLFMVVSRSGVNHKPKEQEKLRGVPVNGILKEDLICDQYNLSTTKCQSILEKPVNATTIYPLQVLSAAPGSGNDWMLWLTNIEVLPYIGEHCRAYHLENLLTAGPKEQLKTHCLYLKTHEPWFYSSPNHITFHSVRAVLMLRHPFDSTFTEFKRRHVEKKLKVTPDLFFKENSTELKTGSKWKSYYPTHYKKWLFHAKYWLLQWKGPLKVILYADMISNTDTELPAVLQYLGFSFEKSLMQRHCCVRIFTNPKLKRRPNLVDQYKEKLLRDDKDLQAMTKKYVNEIQGILNEKWPGIFEIRRR